MLALMNQLPLAISIFTFLEPQAEEEWELSSDQGY